MFKFNFGQSSPNDGNIFAHKLLQKPVPDESPKKDDGLNWLPAKKIDVQSDSPDMKYVTHEFGEFKVKVVDNETIESMIDASACAVLYEIQSQQSDLLPSQYEGGFKIWECTYDLGNYLVEEKIPLSNKTVLDLGCGAGILGILALIQKSKVDFQDYNAEVISNVTIPNVLLNSSDAVAKQCDFYCGDWQSVDSLMCSEKKQYDFIFTSETIYNLNNHRKLYNIFKSTLKNGGIGFVAGKSLYFGVGGSMRQFEKLFLEDSDFDVSVVWKSETGVQREILKLQRKKITETS